MAVAFVKNRIKLYEREICSILAQLAHHIHPAIVGRIQRQNSFEYEEFKRLFSGKVDIDHYLFKGSDCVFPGVRRYVSRRGNLRKYNEDYRAIVDDNDFPRHIWCFLENGKTYNGPNWKKSGLGEFELAHVFTHKESELGNERQFFAEVRPDLCPYGDFTSAANVVLLPKGMVRSTDESKVIKSAFYKRYMDLYGEIPLNGRSVFDESLVPSWYDQLNWNEPALPIGWESKVDKLLAYRTKRVTELLSA